MKILTILGARPQFIKAAAVSAKIQSFNGATETIVHTGQHYDAMMSGVFFEELGIPKPRYSLGVGSGSHAVQTARMLEGIEGVLHEEKPDVVLVYGDTNSTMAGALAAVKEHIPVAHVEAGLRSFNRGMPEEINRVLTDHISTTLFCPTTTAVENLRREGIHKGVLNVGDVMLDAVLTFKERSLEKAKSVLSKIGAESKMFVLGTVHRAENTNDPVKLAHIFDAFGRIASHVPVVVPLHPRTRKYLSEYSVEIPRGVVVIEPVSYIDMVALELHAQAICTDSGGVQKEAYFAQTPCITVREETEWLETVSSGANTLCGSDSDKIYDAYRNIIDYGSGIHYDYHSFGNGEASISIVKTLMKE